MVDKVDRRGLSQFNIDSTFTVTYAMYTAEKTNVIDKEELSRQKDSQWGH